MAWIELLCLEKYKSNHISQRKTNFEMIKNGIVHDVNLTTIIYISTGTSNWWLIFRHWKLRYYISKLSVNVSWDPKHSVLASQLTTARMRSTTIVVTCQSRRMCRPDRSRGPTNTVCHIVCVVPTHTARRRWRSTADGRNACASPA